MTRDPTGPGARLPTRTLDSACQQLFAMALHLRAADPSARSPETCAALQAAHAALDDLRALVADAHPPPRRPHRPLDRHRPVAPAHGPRVRVFVADDHEAVRHGLHAYLGTVPDVVFVGDADLTAAPAELARLAGSAAEPEVVLADTVEPAEIRAFRARGAEVVVVTCCGSPRRARPALAAGAAGYVLKDVDVERVPAAVRAVRQGRLHVDETVMAVMTAAPEDPGPVRSVLTAREREVLAQLAHGRSNRQIGLALGIAERTVQTHLGNALAKLGLHSRTQAALWAVREGLAAP